MADFAALQQKYAPVVDTIKQFEPYGAKFVGSDSAANSITSSRRFPRR